MLPTHGRFAYHPWQGRCQESWPGGRKLAVYLGVNLEHFAFGEGLGAELAPGGPQPDILNHAWRDYGNRVGAWRLLEMLDARCRAGTARRASPEGARRRRGCRSRARHG